MPSKSAGGGQARHLRAPGMAIDTDNKANESCYGLQAAVTRCPLPAMGALAFSSCVETKLCFKLELNPISKFR